jgi:heme-degrading monooxygenase HmoA
MYAHVNIWRLNEQGASTDDTAAREIGSQLSQQAGFHSYTVVRTGEREVVVMSVFETRAELESGVRAVADFTRQRLAPLQAAEPERRAGDVLYHTRA